MLKTNLNKNVNNILIFGLLISLVLSICLLGIFSIPLEKQVAEATLAEPEKDFMPDPAIFGFEPGAGKSLTAYALGMVPSASSEFTNRFNYRIASIDVGGNIYKNFGVYEAYYSNDFNPLTRNDAVDHILRAFMFRKYVFTSLKQEDDSYTTILDETDFDLLFPGDTNSFDNPDRKDDAETEDHEPLDLQITSCNVVGKRWDGSAYSGSLRNIDAAGTYKISQLTVTYDGKTHTALNLHLMILLKARLTVGQTAFSNLFTAEMQFGLSKLERTYGEFADFRDMIGVSNASKEAGKFYFSAGMDKYFFLSSFGKSQGGTAVDSPTVLTNLENVKNYLKIDWYKYSILDLQPVRDLIVDEGIKDAGEYSISLDWTIEFDDFANYAHTYRIDDVTYKSDMSTVVEVVYGNNDSYVDFYKEITINKRHLKFSEDKSAVGGINGGVSITRESEFTGNPSTASNLFSGTKIPSRDMWLSLNGIISDYNDPTVYNGYTFADYISQLPITSYIGTHFNDATIGNDKRVYLDISLLASGSDKINDILKNYEAVFGYYNQGIYIPFSQKSPTEPQFDLETKTGADSEILFDGKFKILPNKIRLNFSKESNYVYGQKGTISSFNFKVDPIVSTVGTIITNDWEIIIVSGAAADAAITDPVKNRIYIGIMTGKRNNDATSNIAYVDGEGNKYTPYGTRLYEGEYYFYYTVHVRHAGSRSSFDGEISAEVDKPGFFNIKNKSGGMVSELDLSQLKLLLISPFKFTVKVNSMINVKDYDGTADLIDFSAVLLDQNGNPSSVGSVYAPDENYVTSSLKARYSYATAGENNPILGEFVLYKIEETSTADNILRSYQIVPGVISGVWEETGTINKLPLAINIVDNINSINIGGVDYPLYKRNYNEMDHVVFRIAKQGDILPDGFVANESYYYFYNPENSNTGVVTAEQLALNRNLGLAPEKCIVITMTGFLDGEGFSWEHSGAISSIPPASIKNIFSWFDTIKGKRIEQNTDSSNDDNDFYRIEFNNEENLAQLFTNYKIIVSPECPDYSYLHIGKLELGASFLYVEGAEMYTYTGLAQIISTVTCEGSDKAIFNFSGHQEAREILNALINQDKTFADLVEVTAFSRDCDERCSHGYYDLNSYEIKNMVISGNYSLKFTLPASPNYKGGVVEGELRIEPKSVEAIITFTVRGYLENNPVYHTDYDKVLYVNNDTELNLYGYWMKIGEEGISYEIIAYPKLKGEKVSYYLISNNEEISTSELQNNHNATRVYIDFNTLNISNQDEFDTCLEDASYVHGVNAIYYKSDNNYIATDVYVSGVTEYYMFNEYTMNNTVIYRGFKVGGGQEAFLAIDTPHSIHFAIDQSNDRAYTNGLNGGVVAQGAFKHNFKFIKTEQKFYILKKGLSIDVGDDISQTRVYTGNELIPLYTLVGGPSNAGGIRVNVHSYTYDGVTQTYEYFIEDIPVEKIPFGFELNIKLLEAGKYTLRLYASASPEFTINYAAKKEAVVIEFEVLPLEITFIGEDISIPYENKEYEAGAFSEYFSGQNSNWGDIEISGITKGEQIVDKIINSGIYQVKILGTLKENYRKNLYFDDGTGSFVYSKEFFYTVTVTPSSSYQFKLTNDIGGVDLDDRDGFRYTYNGKTYYPTYIFNNLEQGTTALPVNFSVKNSKGNNDIIKNADTYTITFEINAYSHINHNSNFASYEGDNALNFTVLVNKASLLVTFGFDEGYSASKTYLDDNSKIAEHMYFIYTGWVLGEDGTEPQNFIENPPVIDWEFFDGDKTITIGTETTAGIYGIRPKSGENTSILSNYYFSYEGSEIAFEIEKANPYLLVYGIYDEENDEYLPYFVYEGTALQPNVKRKYRDGFIDDTDEHLGSGGTKITFMGKFIGLDKNNITSQDILPAGKDCIDVGEYVFSVEVAETSNYNAFPAAYFYIEIVKAELDITVLGQHEGINRGFASTIYNRTENYPTFTIRYSGFVGRDAVPSAYKNDFAIYSHNLRQNTQKIDGLGLTHPTYKIYERSDALGDDLSPYDAGTYYIKLNIDSTYGISLNYNINASYFKEGETTLYPVFVINKRAIDIVAKEMIVKSYDGTTKLLQDSFTKTKYNFTAKNGVEASGVIAGDDINLSVNFQTSIYERKDVNDANGAPSPINIRIYGYSIDNENYYLDISNLLEDENGKYFYLIGGITPVRARIVFLNEQGNVADPRTFVVYDSKPHYLTPKVDGVNGEVLELDVGYTQLYESVNYSDSKAPSEAGEYTVKVTIIDTNYVNTETKLFLIIEKAPVLIRFNGDASPEYANSNMGLTATAYSNDVLDYILTLVVRYYDSENNLVENITTANIGVYKAEAVHAETTNFRHMKASTDFIIRPKGITSITSDVVKQYPYSGKPIVPTFSFEFNNITYYPSLNFDTVLSTENGIVYEPYNYGDGTQTTAPINAGKYRVTPVSLFGNFELLNAELVEYEIIPIRLEIGLNDIKIKENDPIVFSFTLKGNVAGDSISSLARKPSVEYYDNIGNKLNTMPTAAGIYKIMPIDAYSKNYNISYTSGILTINKAILSFKSDTGTDMTIEGNFTSDTSIVVKEIDKVEYSQYKTMFETFKINRPEYSKYQLSTVYHIQFNNGNVELIDDGKMRVKLLLSEVLQGKFENVNSISNSEVIDIKTSNETKYYIAHFSSDGTITTIEAQKEGQYLVFETTSLEAFSVIIESDEQVKDNMWVLYVSIAGGILLILGVLLIIKKRA